MIAAAILLELGFRPFIAYTRLVDDQSELVVQAKNGEERVIHRCRIPFKIPNLDGIEWANDHLVTSFAVALGKGKDRLFLTNVIETHQSRHDNSGEGETQDVDLLTLDLKGQLINRTSATIDLSQEHFLGEGPDGCAMLISSNYGPDSYATTQTGKWVGTPFKQLPKEFQFVARDHRLNIDDLRALKSHETANDWPSNPISFSAEWTDISFRMPNMSILNFLGESYRKPGEWATYDDHQVIAHWGKHTYHLDSAVTKYLVYLHLMNEKWVLATDLIGNGKVLVESDYWVDHAPFKDTLIKMVNLQSGEQKVLAHGFFAIPLD